LKVVFVTAVLVGLVLAGGWSYTGVVDTVGGTTYDNQGTGPACQWVAFDPQYGIHVCWMFSAQGSNWPDRTVRYNFFDRQSGAWAWLDPDFMSSGMNSQTRRTGYGNLDLNPADGVALIGCHYAPAMMQFAPVVVRDLAPGAGVFDECLGAPTLTGYFLPITAVNRDGTVSLLMILFQASDNLFYSRGTTWCTWENPAGWSQTGAFGHNLVASHASNRLLATWMTGYSNELALNYRFSSDAGATWEDIQQFTPPPAYGGDTGTVCYQGAAGFFDRDDNWQIVTVLSPLIADSAYQNPAQLWIYNSNTNEWHRIHRAGAGVLAGELGSASVCGRPSIGQNPQTGRLYVAWEQFDSLNVEPSTNLLRADVWLTNSPDGASWADGTRLTSPDNASKRFVRIASNCSGDSLAIGFEADSIAGFNSDGTGGLSRNPMCIWRGSGIGIAEGNHAGARFVRAWPNPGVRFTVSLPAGVRVCAVRDVSGRLVRELAVRNGAAVWDGLGRDGVSVEPGCYVASWPGGAVKLAVVR
jgi:hypothetical protein